MREILNVERTEAMLLCRTLLGNADLHRGPAADATAGVRVDLAVTAGSPALPPPVVVELPLGPVRRFLFAGQAAGPDEGSALEREGEVAGELAA
ncbi:hypothetical protein, partial [Streptomyces sp. NPDC054838]